MATQLGVFRLRHRPLLIVDRRPSTSTPPRTQAGTRSRSTVQAIRLYIQLFSEYHTEATSLRFLLLTLSSFVVLFTAKLALPRRSSDTQRCHSPIPTGGESISSVPTRSSVQLLPVGVWLAWNGFAPFSPSSSPQSPLVDAASALVLPLRSCHRAAHHSFSCSPPTAPPSSSSSPLPPFVQYFSFPLVHVLPRILVLTPQRIRRTPSGPAVHFGSLPAARKASPDPGRSSRSSSVSIRCQEGVSGIPGGPAVHLTRYPPPGMRIRTPSGPAVHLYSPSAARKAYPDRGWFRRSSSLAIRLQEGVSGPRLVQAFIVTRYPPPGRRIGTPSGPVVHLYSPPAARKAYPDPGWSSRSSSLAVRLQEGVSGPRVVQPFIFTHCPPPGRRFQTATGPTVHLHSLSAARKAHPDPEWSSRSSSLAIRCQEGVSGPRLVQVIIFTRYPPPGRRILTPSGPGVHLHSLSATRKAYPDPEWSRRSSALAIRLQKGVSGPRVVQSFIFTRRPLPGRRIRTLDRPAVHLHTLYASRKAYPDREWSSRSSSLAIRRQEGVSGPRVVQAFIFTRCPLPGRRIQTTSGPGVYPHSLSAARKASPDPERSSRSSSLAIRRQEGVSGPRVVQAFIFTRCPLPGRRIQTTSGPGVYPHSLSAARKASPDPERSSRSSSLAIRRQEGVPGPPVVHPFIFSRYPPPGGRFRTGTGPGVHLRSSIRLQEGVYGPEGPTVPLNSPIRRSEDACGSRMVQSFSSARLSATR